MDDERGDGSVRVRRTALPQPLFAARRRLVPGGAGRAGGGAGLPGPGPHRPRRPVWRGTLLAGSAGAGHPAHRRGRAHPGWAGAPDPAGRDPARLCQPVPAVQRRATGRPEGTAPAHIGDSSPARRGTDLPFRVPGGRGSFGPAGRRRGKSHRGGGPTAGGIGPGAVLDRAAAALLPTDRRLEAELADLAGRLGAGLVATNNVHYAERAGQRLHDVLTCIRHLTPCRRRWLPGCCTPTRSST